jgi:hypothetical protein
LGDIGSAAMQVFRDSFKTARFFFGEAVKNAVTITVFDHFLKSFCFKKKRFKKCQKTVMVAAFFA